MSVNSKNIKVNILAEKNEHNVRSSTTLEFRLCDYYFGHLLNAAKREKLIQEGADQYRSWLVLTTNSWVQTQKDQRKETLEDTLLKNIYNTGYAKGMKNSLSINPSIAKTFNEKENELLQYFLDNINVRDFFKVEVIDEDNDSETAKIFVEKDDQLVDVTSIFAQILENPISYGAITLTGTGIDRFLQAICLMYTELVAEVSAKISTSNSAAAQSYAKI